MVFCTWPCGYPERCWRQRAVIAVAVEANNFRIGGSVLNNIAGNEPGKQHKVGLHVFLAVVKQILKET